MIKKFRNERGSITLFILASCMVFLVSIIGVFSYIKNKEITMDEQYTQIKKRYEVDLNNKDKLYKIEASNAKISNISINFESQEGYFIPTGSSNVQISQRFKLESGTKSSIKSISYAWSDNADITPNSWEYLSSIYTEYTVKLDNAKENNYYLWIKVTDDYSNEEKIFKNESPIKVRNGEILIEKVGTIANIKFPEDILIYNKKVGQGTDLENAKINVKNNDSASITLENETNTVYVQATDAHGNKIYNSTI